MNRNGLVVALLVGVCVGVVFAVYPQLDIAISRLFFNESYRVFPVQYSLVARHLRDIFSYIVALLVAPAFIAIGLKLVFPRRPTLIAGRAAVFLIATLALAPGLMANVILKDYWGRPRPADRGAQLREQPDGTDAGRSPADRLPRRDGRERDQHYGRGGCAAG